MPDPRPHCRLDLRAYQNGRLAPPSFGSLGEPRAAGAAHPDRSPARLDQGPVAAGAGPFGAHGTHCGCLGVRGPAARRFSPSRPTKGDHRVQHLRRGALSIAAAGALVATPALAMGAGVSPATYDASVDPGATVHVTKTVSTPEIPPKPDIVLVVDRPEHGPGHRRRQGRDGLIDSVQAAQPDAEFAIASYKDVGDGARVLPVETGLTGGQATAQTAIDSLSASGGGDTPEGQINALWEVGSGGDAIAFRLDSSRIVVWFGDASGHDPAAGTARPTPRRPSRASAPRSSPSTSSPEAADGLDTTGQAQRIAAATRRTFFPNVTPGRSSPSTILAGLATCRPRSRRTSRAPRACRSRSRRRCPRPSRAAGRRPRRGDHRRLGRAPGLDADLHHDLPRQRCRGRAGVRPDRDHQGQRRDPADRLVRSRRQPGGPPSRWVANAGFFQIVAADNLPGASVTISDTGRARPSGRTPPGPISS